MNDFYETAILYCTSTPLFYTGKYFYVVFLLEGELHVKVGPDIEIMQAGQCLIVNRYSMCQLQSKQGCFVQVIQIEAEQAANLYPEINHTIFKSASLRYALRSDRFIFGRDQIFLSNCLNLWKAKAMKEQSRHKQINYILSLLCLEYTAFNNQESQYSFMSEEKKERILLILEMLQNSREEKITLKKAADLVNITPQYLSAMWKDCFGYSFMEHVMKIRLCMAESLLFQSDLSITEIILQCGFSDRKYFYQCFKEAYHDTPSHWKKRWSQVPAVYQKVSELEANAVIQQVIHKHNLFEKPMDSIMNQKYEQLKKMEENKIQLKDCIISIDLSETMTMQDDHIQPLVMFGFDLLMRFLVERNLGLRVIIPIAYFKQTQNKARRKYNAVSVKSYVMESLVRFGRFYLSRWQVDLLCQNQEELKIACQLKEEFRNQGIGSVSILF